MNATLVIAAISAAIDLTEKLLPLLESLRSDGEITAEQQQAVLDAYQRLKTRADGQFSGPQWQVSGSQL